MRVCLVSSLLLSLVKGQEDNTYWGSYGLTIPGGSGAGDATQLLTQPDNAPNHLVAFDLSDQINRNQQFHQQQAQTIQNQIQDQGSNYGGQQQFQQQRPAR